MTLSVLAQHDQLDFIVRPLNGKNLVVFVYPSSVDLNIAIPYFDVQNI